MSGAAFGSLGEVIWSRLSQSHRSGRPSCDIGSVKAVFALVESTMDHGGREAMRRR